MAIGKSINLFLMEGEASGPIKCSLTNWTGLVFKIPRTSLDFCKGRKDLKYSGVYLLFGNSDETGESYVYVGQAGVRKNGEGVLGRLLEHKRNPRMNYWTEAVVFTTSNNTFGPTEISYLENRFTKMAQNAGRYQVQNGNEPTHGNITEEKQCEMDEYINNAQLIIGTLGHRVFEPLLPYSSSNAAYASLMEPASAVPSREEQEIFFCKSRQSQAKGRITPEGFVVLAGSRIDPNLTNSCPNFIRKLRVKYASKIGPDFAAREDLLFSSPSTASGFVLGRSSNGLIDWKTASGQTLREFNSTDQESGS